MKKEQAEDKSQHQFEKKDLDSPFEEGSKEENNNFTCPECNRSFKTERGMHIHKGKKHKEEEQHQQEETTTKQPQKEKTQQGGDQSKQADQTREQDESKFTEVKNKEEIDKELREIFEDNNGEVPDMAHFQTKQSNSMLRGFIILLISLLFLGSVAWLGFFFFEPQDRFTHEDVKFSIVGQEQLQSGNDIHYRIRYHNNQQVPLSKVDLFVRYPEGFTFKRSSPEPMGNGKDSWKLGTLQEQESGFIDIYGKLYGDVGEKQSLRAFLNYTPANFSSEFQKVSSLSTQIRESPVQLKLSGPDSLPVGEEGKWKVNLISESVRPVENLEVKISTGDNFLLTGTEPETSSTSKYSWHIKQLKNKRELNFSGVFEEKKKKEELKVEVFNVRKTDEEKEKTKKYLIAEQSKSVQLTDTDVKFDLAINGALNNFSTQPGESLNTSLSLENTRDKPIKDAQIKMVFDAPSNDRQPILERSILHWENIKNAATEDIVGDQINENTRRGTLTWTSEQNPNLANIKPGEEVNIDFTLPIKSHENTDLTEFDTSKVTAKADMKYKIGDKVNTVSSNKINITINSDLSINVKDTVSNQDGKPVHNVSWTLDNNFHKLKNIKAEADIFGEIDWIESALNTTTGKAHFDHDTQHLTWEINSLPKNSDKQTLNFAVKMKKQDPTQTNLTTKVHVRAKDQTTGKKIIITGDEILLRNSVSSQN